MSQRQRVADALSLTCRWRVDTVAAAAVLPGGSTVEVGPTGRPFRLASISKMLVGWAALVAAEEGVLDLDEPLAAIGSVDMAGATPRHLLAHAAGFAFDSAERLAAPGTRRIYSNTGIELLAAHLAAVSGMEFADYLGEAVLEPLGMADTSLLGSPARDVHGTVDDLVRFARETQAPTLVTPESALDFRSVQFGGLPGIVPGVGRFADCAWGLGTEIRGAKQPHWTGTRNSGATYGHFGGAGTLLWIDPAADVACIALTDRPFDEWASEALVLWPALADALLDAVSGTVADTPASADAAAASPAAASPAAASPAAATSAAGPANGRIERRADRAPSDPVSA